MADGPGFSEGQIVTVFRNRLRDDNVDEYYRHAAEILALAREMPGFVDFKTFAADDGERVSLVTFQDAESQRAWRTHVDHRAAQQAGRAKYYAGYSIQVATCTSVRTFTTEESTTE
jgi:heme-degrading monooxygenase HmoA